MHLHTDFSIDNNDDNNDYRHHEYGDDNEDGGDADGSACAMCFIVVFDKFSGVNKCMLDVFQNQIICTNTYAQYFAWSACFVEGSLGKFYWV